MSNMQNSNSMENSGKPTPSSAPVHLKDKRQSNATHAGFMESFYGASPVPSNLPKPTIL